jgi:hypothetical protein
MLSPISAPTRSVACALWRLTRTGAFAEERDEPQLARRSVLGENRMFPRLARWDRHRGRVFVSRGRGDGCRSAGLLDDAAAAAPDLLRRRGPPTFFPYSEEISSQRRAMPRTSPVTRKWHFKLRKDGCAAVGRWRRGKVQPGAAGRCRRGNTGARRGNAEASQRRSFLAHGARGPREHTRKRAQAGHNAPTIDSRPWTATGRQRRTSAAGGGATGGGAETASPAKCLEAPPAPRGRRVRGRRPTKEG